MTEKSLLSLREIASELNLNYSTILNFKNQLTSFLPKLNNGKNFAYYPETIEILQLISALREEGCTFDLIRDIFSQRKNLKHDPQLNEWVEEIIAKYAHYWSHECAHKCASVNKHTQAYASVHQHTPDYTSVRQYAPECASVHLKEPAQTGIDKHEEAYTGTDQHEQAYTGANQETPEAASDEHIEKIIEQRLNQAKNEILVEVLNNVDEKVRERTPDIQDRLENALLQYKAGINGAMTQIYKAIQELQEGIQALDQRLGHLERELENEQGETIHLKELDLEALQIQSVEINILNQNNPEEEYTKEDRPTPEINLEQVQSSIYNGRPDREAVIEWIMEEKAKDPNVSYGELARRLNDAGIPTLSGRDTWCRTVVRSLAIKEKNGVLK